VFHPSVYSGSVSKTASLVRITVAYAVAIAAALAWLVLGPDTDRLWLDAFLADVVATLVIFGFSRAYKNSSFYDAYWSVVPPLLLLFWWVETDAEHARVWLVAGVMLLWAIRLTGNWVYSWPGLHHEDWRYPLLKQKAGRWEAFVDLAAIHVIPTIQVFLGTIPAYVVVTSTDREIGMLDAVALTVGVGAVALELVADVQLHRFVRDRQPGQVMDRGLWGWSRHPNYFGEISFWLSLSLFGIAAAPDDAWWLFIGPVAMLAMFLGASIPMMEQRSLERRPQYQDVIDRVPKLIPRPPRKVRV
jgi:steroid 5-alpha reductase family enzyme